jgi:flavin reductase ActVB
MKTRAAGGPRRFSGSFASMLNINQFKEVFARYPSGVVIVTTRTAEGEAKGFTASSFTSVSADPPLVLTCLNLSAECYPAFKVAQNFAISILRPHHQDIAQLFAKRGADKFVPGQFVDGPYGLPMVSDSLATLICAKAADYPGGDHIIIMGEVKSIELGSAGEGMVHYQRRFWGVGEAAAS